MRLSTELFTETAQKSLAEANKASPECKEKMNSAFEYLKEMARAYKNRDGEGFWLSVAGLYSDAVKVHTNCKNFQTAWNYAVDVVVPAVHSLSANPTCMKGLYA